MNMYSDEYLDEQSFLFLLPLEYPNPLFYHLLNTPPPYFYHLEYLPPIFTFLILSIKYLKSNIYVIEFTVIFAIVVLYSKNILSFCCFRYIDLIIITVAATGSGESIKHTIF